ncbi:MAG: T9SS type A sorting domain-containing protein, partial [Phaeodactylibacter sp.]|nr:T9SS type A sorting domain-containing protein [Phaeodactylibacter sp.]
YASFFDEAEKLAQLGFIAASIQYRLCKRGDCVLAAGTSIPCNVSWSNSLVPSAYVAALDAADAVEWLKLHAASYQIDVDKIAVGGHSAGAWTAMHLAFMDQEEATELCPSCGTWPDYLEGELSAPTGIKAVINMSGAILDTLWMDPEEADIDVMTIHGTHDGVVHYGSEPVYPCCNTYSTAVQGACPITARQLNLGGNNYLLTGQNFGHDVFTADWWPQSELQILWFLGKSLFEESSFALHTEQVRNTPVETCPPPFAPIIPATICSLPLEAPQVVFFEALINQTRETEQSRISCYPNPTANLLTVDLGTNTLPRQIDLYDTMGHLLKSVRVSTSESQIELGALPAGLYLLRVGTFIQEIVVLPNR